MSTKPLSRRAEILLGIVREVCKFDDNGVVERYFIPKRCAYFTAYGEALDVGDTYICGSGDAAVFRNLERRGFTRPIKASSYYYVITEQGIIEYERIAARKRLERGEAS